MDSNKVRIGVLLANKADELQTIIPIQIWKKAGFIVELISLEKKNSVILSQEVKLSCNGTSQEININQFNSLYIPGGDILDKFFDPKLDPRIMKTLQKDFIKDKKNIFAMDEALLILYKWELIRDRKFTTSKSLKELKEKYPKLFDEKNSIVVSKGLVTGTGRINAIDFALEVVKYHGKSQEAKKILAEIK